MEKIGLAICHCGLNIAGVLDIKRIKNFFKKDPKNLYVFDENYLCSDAGLKAIDDIVGEQKITRVVIAACSIKLHGDMFREHFEKIGISRDLVAFVNIREQNSWVHTKEPALATQKAIEQIQAKIEYVKLLEPQERVRVPVTQEALVIGGGIAGIHGALAIANAGYHVYLVEKDSTIGGHMPLFDKTFPTMDCSICILGPIMNEVKEHPNITLMTYTEVIDVSGYIGNFQVKIKKKARYVDLEKCVGCFDLCRGVCDVELPGRFFPMKAIDVKFPGAIPLVPVINMDYCTGCGACELACDREAIIYDDKDAIEDIKVGAILVATGFKDFDPTGLREYKYSLNPNIITALEMERMLNPEGPTRGKISVPSTGLPPKKVGFILCVGSRNKNLNREYCSNVCCMYSIKQAILIKERVPNCEVYVFYNDIRANFKMGENFYNRAREENHIHFQKGTVSDIQSINGEEDDAPTIKLFAEDTMQGVRMEDEFDLVVLATGMDPPDDTDKIANMLNISKDPYGFLMASHLKVRPSQSSLHGIYLAGTIHGPKDIPSSILQAESAAVKILSILIKKELEIAAVKVHLDEDKCDLCRLCLDVCDYQALSIENKKIVLNSANCLGCGACAAMCHTNALWIPGFSSEQIERQIDSYLANKSQAPLILAFLCNWCAYPGADLAGTNKIQYPTNIRVIRVNCAGMVNPSWVVKALLEGADGVIVIGCYEQDCHFTSGFTKAKNWHESTLAILEELNIDTNRIRLENISAGEGKKFADIVFEFSNSLIKKK
ncbi:MAG: hydrogenase iron-sulfur subunit [Candidatus Lokiarchaeota archaeon]|nr:hydrogenase iron-sulfur subunit [Candidatus Lokiarchaeota archaeon]